MPKPCPSGEKNELANCNFLWTPGGDPDPCEKEKEICFTPGCDPFSFIATVVLPAWPRRFRSASSRQLIEKLLQRQAPAHVLLRILWMRPRDFCCFESHYKTWGEWLGNKLAVNYDKCNFLGFLFRKTFETPVYDCITC
jgi:hypothetical protein